MPELLAPAGSEESLRAALAAGADAVYFGGAMFSNRMRAKNFAGESIRDAIKLCHSVGAAAHITVNTRVYDREFDPVLAFADILLGGREDERADALIVADLGVASAILAEFPHASLHASTQTSMMSLADCRALAELGFSRLVVPRELSLPEIRALAESSPVEIEMFIHGAHCVSCSGQCLLSYVMGGRSGNRGECAQPCRLPYTATADGRQTGGSYPLSLADMYLGGHITEILSSGVASLKIEGRLKSPSYVYGVTSVYRRLLDERRNATANEKRALEDLFTRGFTDGYFTSRYALMSGVKSSEKAVNSAETQRTVSEKLALRRENERKKKNVERQTDAVPLTARFSLRAEECAVFELYLDGEVGRASGEVPAPSTGNPITKETAAKNLTKLGGSGFSLSPDDIEFSLDDGLWLPLSALNGLRRAALDDLMSRLGDGCGDAPAEDCETTRFTLPPKNQPRRECGYVAEIADLTHFFGGKTDVSRLAGFAEKFSRVVLPAEDLIGLGAEAASLGGTICASLPVLVSEKGAEKILKSLADCGCRRVVCHTAGQIGLALSHGMIADLSFRGNVTNSAAAQVYARLGAASVILSPEVTLTASRDIAQSCSVPVGVICYGRIPVMHLSRCVISGGQCRKGNVGGRRDGAGAHNCEGELTDRLGERFPVLARPDCTNIVYNSTPIWMGEKKDRLSLGGYCGEVVFLFTTETVDEADDVIRAYEAGEKRDGRKVQR